MARWQGHDAFPQRRLRISYLGKRSLASVDISLHTYLQPRANSQSRLPLPIECKSTGGRLWKSHHRRHSSIKHNPSVPSANIGMLSPPSTPMVAPEDSSFMSLISGATFSLHECQTPSESSFGWSDLPCQGEQVEFETTASADKSYPQSPLPPSPPSPTSTILRKSFLEEEVASDCSSDSDDDVVVPVVKSKTAWAHKPRVGGVWFSDIVEIRTHEITVGFHPCAKSGLAMSCDWSYEESYSNLEVHEDNSLKRRSNELRLSYMERKQRLLEVTGVSPCELLEQEYAVLRFVNDQDRETLARKSQEQSSCPSSSAPKSSGRRGMLRHSRSFSTAWHFV